jgi:hypothetical protein
LNRGQLRFACARAHIAAMSDREYWTKKLKDAERELEAATRLSDVNTAAKKLMRAKAELKRLEQAAAAG